MASRGTLRLRAIQPPPGRRVAPTNEAGAKRAAEWTAANTIGAGLRALAPHAKPYAGARWPYELHKLARVDAKAERVRRLRKRVWFTRSDEKPFRLGLDRILPRAIAGLRAVST